MKKNEQKVQTLCNDIFLFITQITKVAIQKENRLKMTIPSTGHHPHGPRRPSQLAQVVTFRPSSENEEAFTGATERQYAITQEEFNELYASYHNSSTRTDDIGRRYYSIPSTEIARLRSNMPKDLYESVQKQKAAEAKAREKATRREMRHRAPANFFDRLRNAFDPSYNGSQSYSSSQ